MASGRTIGFIFISEVTTDTKFKHKMFLSSHMYMNYEDNTLQLLVTSPPQCHMILSITSLLRDFFFFDILLCSDLAPHLF